MKSIYRFCWQCKRCEGFGGCFDECRHVFRSPLVKLAIVGRGVIVPATTVEMAMLGMVGVMLCVTLYTLVVVRRVQAMAKLDKADRQHVQEVHAMVQQLRSDLLAEQRAQRLEQQQQMQSVLATFNAQNENQQRLWSLQDTRLQELSQALNASQSTLNSAVDRRLQLIEQRISETGSASEQRLQHMQAVLAEQLSLLRSENNAHLEEMRATVDEKLQHTLELRLGQSFSLVNERLEQVYRGLGEMQALAVGVGDLKRVLSNVKTRGILGEVQLGAILEQLLSPDQYCKNVATRPDSQQVVEFALKLPGDDRGPVLLPIDAKFPTESYHQLREAFDKGDVAAIRSAEQALDRAIRGFARDISTKYIEPPFTTEFAIMFLPVEGLYAEVVRLGMVETLQREYQVTIAGPTTMAALLNSLQMGFRTLAIQKRSSEVWQILGAVKSEFNKFGDVLQATQRRLDQAYQELDKLVGVRTRQIQRRLRSVEELANGEESLLYLDAVEPDDPERI